MSLCNIQTQKRTVIQQVLSENVVQVHFIDVDKLDEVNTINWTNGLFEIRCSRCTRNYTFTNRYKSFYQHAGNSEKTTNTQQTIVLQKNER